MNLQAIFHQPKSNYCYAYNKETIEIRLRAGKEDLTKVTLVFGDKYDWKNKVQIPMKVVLSDELYDYFTVKLKAPNDRLSYYFIIEKEEEKKYYTEWGLLEDIDEDEIHLHFFNYPYVNEIDIHRTPDWVKDSIFYQIFPDRFYNGDSTINPKEMEKWGKAPKWNNFFGGDLKGIEKQLDYLEELGINAIYLTPVFQSTTNHKYNTTDYMKIDPHFGTKETLKELVAKCHEKGIKVVLDAVFNHSGDDFAPFQDVVEKGKESSYHEWFHINSFPITTNPLNYDTFGFVDSMPKLNTANEELKKYLLDIGKYWIEECDIDGWRLDVANEVDHNFWRDFRKAVKEVKEDAYIVGEIWFDSLPWLRGDQFDATMNYPVTRACKHFFAYENIHVNEFKNVISSTLMRNTQQVNEVMLNLLDSHDTERFLTSCNGDADKLILSETFLLTYVGAISIYYGTEIGMEGKTDPDCRRTMDWNKNNWNQHIYQSIKKLIQIRLNHKALRRGSFKWIDGLNEILGFIRENEEEKIIVLINNSNINKEVELDIDSTECTELIEDKKILIKDKKLNTTIKAKSAIIICVEK